jgi:hypothetical protein
MCRRSVDVIPIRAQRTRRLVTVTTTSVLRVRVHHRQRRHLHVMPSCSTPTERAPGSARVDALLRLRALDGGVVASAAAVYSVVERVVVGLVDAVELLRVVIPDWVLGVVGFEIARRERVGLGGFFGEPRVLGLWVFLRLYGVEDGDRR